MIDLPLVESPLGALPFRSLTQEAEHVRRDLSGDRHCLELLPISACRTGPPTHAGVHFTETVVECRQVQAQCLRREHTFERCPSTAHGVDQRAEDALGLVERRVQAGVEPRGQGPGGRFAQNRQIGDTR